MSKGLACSFKIPTGHHIGVEVVLDVFMVLIGPLNVLDVVSSISLRNSAGPETSCFKDNLGPGLKHETGVSARCPVQPDSSGHRRTNVVFEFSRAHRENLAV